MPKPKLVNLTPHPVVLIRDGGAIEIPPSGVVPRLREIVEDTGDTVEGVPIVRKGYGEIQGLPDPEPDTYYIVSALVAQAARARGLGRDDLLIPDDLVRDEQGRVIGARRLARPL